MDGNSARDEMFKMFQSADLPDGVMTFKEQKNLAMWVRDFSCSIHIDLLLAIL